MAFYVNGSGLIVVGAGGALYASGGGSPNYVGDYFVSPTGNDANAGTSVSAPWAITSFLTTSSNWSKINGTGKKIGLMPGTYDISGMMLADPVVGAIQWPGGLSSAAPTVIFSCDSSGSYSRGSCTITAKTAGGVYGGHAGSLTFNGPMISHSGTYPTAYAIGNMTVDGPTITGWSYKGIRIGGISGGYGAGNIQNIIMQNMWYTDGGPNPTDPTDNSDALWMDGCTGAIVQNNYFNGGYHGFGGSTTSADHINGVIYWQCVDCITRYNTCQQGGNIYGKEILNQGHQIYANLVDMTGWSAGTSYCIQDFTGANSAGLTHTTNIFNNIMISPGRCLGGATLSNSYGWTTPINIYNNLAVTNSSLYSAYWVQSQNTLNNLNFYNNMIAASITGGAGGSGGSDKMFHVNPGSPVIWDYNFWPATGNTWQLVSNANGTVVIASYTSLATFQSGLVANGGISNADLHGIGSSAPVFVNTGSSSQLWRLDPSSPGYQQGSTTGTTGGSPTDMGAWGNGATQIGALWVP